MTAEFQPLVMKHDIGYIDKLCCTLLFSVGYTETNLFEILIQNKFRLLISEFFFIFATFCVQVGKGLLRISLESIRFWKTYFVAI